MHHKNYDWALLVLRVVVGIVFIAHGWDKWQNLSGTTGFFASVGLPVFLVYVVALIELLGGLAILLGVKTRLAGYLLAVVMAGAILLVKGKMGFLGGYEYDLTLLAAALALAMLPPGHYVASKRTLRN
jgi:uncharacterized membrane protein YphA (DoxX/SURF4 family)